MRVHRLVRPLACLAALLSLAPAPRVRAGVNTWTTGGPSGAWVRTLAIDPIDPSVMYAGTQVMGVQRTTDGGASWAPSNTGLTDPGVAALVLDPVLPAIVYAGTLAAGVFQSLDGGTTWSPISNGLTTPAILSLAIDQLDRTVLWAGTDGGGIFKTTDGGATWTAMNAGLTAPIVHAIAIDPSASDVVYAGTTTGSVGAVFKTVDGGTSWSPTGAVAAPAVLSLLVDPATPTTVYAGTFFTGMRKSVDGGDLWASINSGLDGTTVRAIARHPVDAGALYVATTAGAFVSTSGGAGWSALNTGLTHTNLSSIRLDPTDPRFLHAGALGGGGVFHYEQNACEAGGAPIACGGCEVCNPALGCVGDFWDDCRVPTALRKAALHINDKAPDSRDSLVWKWNRGEATELAAFGDPLATTAYEVCIFDQSGPVPMAVMHAVVEPGGVCNGKDCWKAVADRRFKYRNGEAVPDGVTKLQLNKGEDEKAKIVLKGKGELLALPTLPLPMPFHVQLRNDLGECWQAIYTEAGLSRNDAAKFVGKSGL